MNTHKINNKKYEASEEKIYEKKCSCLHRKKNISIDNVGHINQNYLIILLYMVMS